GGAERFFVELINALNRENFEPYVMCVFKTGALASDLAKDVPVYEVGKRSKLGLLTLCKLYRKLREIQPDIVHTSLFGGDLWGRIAAVCARVPTIISTEQNLHTTDRFRERFSKRLLNVFTKRVIFISNAVRHDYVKHVPISRDKMRIIPNATSLARYRHERLQFHGTTAQMVVIARLVPQKGHEVLLNALAMIRHASWVCRMVGDGVLSQTLKERVKALGLENQVLFLGERHDVPQLLRNADISILPSIFEGQGIALLESAASGCFIIASNVDGISEVFEDGKTAHLVRPGDPEAIARSILWFMKHHEEAMSIALSAQSMVFSKFDIAVIAKQYEQEYVNL
ncbi:MAG TPA: glycosyltransferase, partial [Patescibacteria group bacterium]|nr:glycosyltransferase [Patescibacteria group bacterium]